MKPDSTDRLDYVNALGNQYSIDKNALISHLSKTYSIDEPDLRKYIQIETELVDIKRPEEFLISRTLVMHQGNEFGAPRLKHDAPPRRHDDSAHYHLGITDDRVKLKIGKQHKVYRTLSDFLEEFPQIILFVVPVFGAFESSNDNLIIQAALKKSAIEFGRSVADHVVVFDYWTKPDFDYEQYRLQERFIMRKFKVGKKSLPSLLVSNRCPFSWDEADKARKMVILKFRNFGISDLGPRLLQIADDLEKQDLPSEWLHDWRRLINWAKSKGIGTKALGVALKAAKLGV